LSGYRVEVEFRLEPPDATQLELHEIEVDGAIAAGLEGYELASQLRVGPVMDILQVGGLAAHGWPVVYDLEVDLPHFPVDEHRAPTGNGVAPLDQRKA
jgi:hypothetical protein